MVLSASVFMKLKLQWGRTPVSAERAEYLSAVSRGNQLQWGRTPVSAESEKLRAVDRYGVTASMGPHSGECGKVPPTLPVMFVADGFNGAALR